jgi:hypothetical protein
VFDAALGIQQVDLHRGIHGHQHRQQGLAGGAVGVVAVGRGDLGPMLDDVPGEAVRQPLRRLLRVLARDLAAEQQDESAVGQQQHRQGEGEAGGERAPLGPGRQRHATASKR